MPQKNKGTFLSRFKRKIRLEVVKKRRQAKVEGPQDSVRYFIAKENGVTTLPQLGKEFASEKEALIESLRTGQTFFAISEWKAIPDFSGKNPQILKQMVASKPHS